MRNADYSPTRFHSLYDSLNTLMAAKSRSNVETTFAVLSLTGKVLHRVHSAPIRGNVNLIKGLKIAERENKHYHKRIVAFVGSPFTIDLNELSALACKFVEDNVRVDIILFGEETCSAAEPLKNFIEILNSCSDQSSHLLVVPPGDSMARLLKASEIMPETQRTTAVDDLDMEADPDLAEAIRLSLRDAGVNLQKQNTNDDQTYQTQLIETDTQPNFDAMTEQEQIEWAMKMSLADSNKQEQQNEEKKSKDNTDD